MTKENNKTKKGFTIIEVVLVLAIAGLIFLMVFVALPALQRSQRDTQRRDDMARFASQLNQYQSNNGGKVPDQGGTSDGTWNDKFIKPYLQVQKTDSGSTKSEDSFVDPSGEDYNVASVTKCTDGKDGCKQASVNDDYKFGNIRVYTNAKCNGEDPEYIKGDRKIAFTYKLEGAGTYCGNN